jgi:Arc/MetJ-type ribon-helix-helix transcriptional regulator
MVYGMKNERIEVRLDEEHVRKIAELKATYDASTSEVIRRAIDTVYEETSDERRREAARRLVEMTIPDDVPDPDELSRQLDEAHDPGIP